MVAAATLTSATPVLPSIESPRTVPRTAFEWLQCTTGHSHPSHSQVGLSPRGHTGGESWTTRPYGQLEGRPLHFAGLAEGMQGGRSGLSDRAMYDERTKFVPADGPAGPKHCDPSSETYAAAIRYEAEVIINAGCAPMYRRPITEAEIEQHRRSRLGDCHRVLTSKGKLELPLSQTAMPMASPLEAVLEPHRLLIDHMVHTGHIPRMPCPSCHEATDEASRAAARKAVIQAQRQIRTRVKKVAKQGAAHSRSSDDELHRESKAPQRKEVEREAAAEAGVIETPSRPRSPEEVTFLSGAVRTAPFLSGSDTWLEIHSPAQKRPTARGHFKSECYTSPTGAPHRSPRRSPRTRPAVLDLDLQASNSSSIASDASTHVSPRLASLSSPRRSHGVLIVASSPKPASEPSPGVMRFSTLKGTYEYSYVDAKGKGRIFDERHLDLCTDARYKPEWQ